MDNIITQVAAYVSGAVLAIGLVIGLVLVSDPQEDEPFWNCHLDGDQCGSEAVWHGFVNYTDALPF